MTWNELKEHKLVIYSTAWCGDCKRLKMNFAQLGIPINEIDIDEDPIAAKRLQEMTGKTAIPFVEIDDKVMIKGWDDNTPGGFDQERFLDDAKKALQ